MSNLTSSSHTSERIGRLWKAYFFGPWNGRRLVVTAMALHVVLAVGLSVAGRMTVAPTMIDSDGIMGSFAADSYEYQRDAIQLAELLKSGHIANWFTAARPVHAKIIAIPFAIIGPVFGYGTLAAEPYNLLFYATIIALVFAIGREVFNDRVGLLAGTVVALYPSFLLHTLQLLKDPLVVTASLALVLCVTTWLTRNHSARSGALSAVVMAFIAVSIFFARTDLLVVVFAMALLGLMMLGIRQVLERRYLFWNMILPVTILLVTVLLLSASNPTRTKQFPATQIGPPKVATSLQVPSLLVRVNAEPKSPLTIAARLRTPADALAKRVGSMRFNFAAGYPEAGSMIDSGRQFKNLNDLVSYLPRAIEIGLWAPFPNSWIEARRRVGNAGQLLASVETFFIYLFQLLAICALIREPRRLTVWLLLAIVILAVTALAVVVPNVGALYRYRYAFWLLVIVTAMTVVDSVFERVRRATSMGAQV